MIVAFVFIFGLTVGSFLNVLIDRLPNDKSILGRSHCDYCRKTLQPQDLIPIISYIILKGRCRFCKKSLSFQYPLIELLTGLFFVLTWIVLADKGIGEQSYTMAIMAVFIAMFFSDIKYQILPDEEQVALLTISLIFLITNGASSTSLIERFVFSFAAMVPLLLLYLATKGKGMGFGDVKLSFVLGFLFGLQGALIILYIAFITGGIFGTFALLTKLHRLKSKIAFGPFLIIGAVVYLFFGAYLNSQLHLRLGI